MHTILFLCLFVAADEKRWAHTCPIAGCMGAKGQRGEPGPVGPQVGSGVSGHTDRVAHEEQ